VDSVERAWCRAGSVTGPSLSLCFAGLCLFELSEPLAGYVQSLV
jgi:hypothetical protein